MNKGYRLLNVKFFQIICVQGAQPRFTVEIAREAWDRVTRTLGVTLCGWNPNARPITTFWPLYLAELCGQVHMVEHPNPWVHLWVAPLILKNDIAFDSISSIGLVTTHAVMAHIANDISVTDKIIMTIARGDAVLEKLEQEEVGYMICEVRGLRTVLRRLRLAAACRLSTIR